MSKGHVSLTSPGVNILGAVRIIASANRVSPGETVVSIHGADGRGIYLYLDEASANLLTAALVEHTMSSAA